MNVIRPETKSEVRHLGSTLPISSQKNAVAAIIAIEPIKKVKATACSSENSPLKIPAASVIDKLIILFKFLIPTLNKKGCKMFTYFKGFILND